MPATHAGCTSCCTRPSSRTPTGRTSAPQVPDPVLMYKLADQLAPDKSWHCHAYLAAVCLIMDAGEYNLRLGIMKELAPDMVSTYQGGPRQCQRYYELLYQPNAACSLSSNAALFQCSDVVVTLRRGCASAGGPRLHCGGSHQPGRARPQGRPQCVPIRQPHSIALRGASLSLVCPCCSVATSGIVHLHATCGGEDLGFMVRREAQMSSPKQR